MEVKEIQNGKAEIIIDIICDCCGNSCKVYEGVIDNDLRLDNGEKFYEFSCMNMQATWGYFSGKDLLYQTAHVCEKCVDEKLSFIKFKKEPYHVWGKRNT